MAFKCFSLFLLVSLATFEYGDSLKVLVSPNIKKILVIGSTGQAGSKIVQEALDRGLQVKAFSRNPSKLPQEVKDKVEVVSGDVQNYEDVHNAVKGVDAVIFAISPRSLDDTSKYMTRGLQNVLKAMKEEYVEVINVLLSVFSIMPTEEIPEMFRIETEDQQDMYNALKNSDLKYIASCPPNFIPTPYNAYESEVGGMPGGKNFNGGINVISLNQLGKYFIDSLTETKYYRQIVGLRNKVIVKGRVKSGVKSGVKA